MSDPSLLPSAASGMTGWLEGSLPCMERHERVTGSASGGGSLPCIVKASGWQEGLAGRSLSCRSQSVRDADWEDGRA